MSLKKNRLLWLSLAITFLVGIFSLAIEQTSASALSINQSNNTEKAKFNLSSNFGTTALAEAEVVLIGVLIYSIVMRRKKMEG